MKEQNMTKKYHIGMYGGKFLPFHLGHRYCIEYAAKECDMVYAILFYGGKEEEDILKSRPDEWLSLEMRKKKLAYLCDEINKELYSGIIKTSGREGFAVIPGYINITSLRLPDGSEDWDAETPLVRAICGNKLDAVYSSEISYGEYFSHAYPEAIHRLVDVPRVNYPISGTAIRSFTDEEERKKWMV